MLANNSCIEFTSTDDLVREIVERTVEGDEAVYWKSDTTDENGEPVLQFAAEPTSNLFRLRVGVSVAQSDSEAGIPDVLEASPYTDEFADDWFDINTTIGELGKKGDFDSANEFEFEEYEDEIAWYHREYTDTSLISKLRKML